MFQINIEPGEEFLPKCLQQILDNSELVTIDSYQCFKEQEDSIFLVLHDSQNDLNIFYSKENVKIIPELIGCLTTHLHRTLQDPAKYVGRQAVPMEVRKSPLTSVTTIQ